MKVSCPICQEQSKLLRNFAERAGEKLDLYRCQKCEQEFLHPFPSDEWLGEEYSQYYQKRQAGNQGGKVEYFTGLLQSLGLDFNGRSVLEFGPGEGDAILAMTKLGTPSKITVVERNDEANALLEKLKCSHHNMFLEDYIKANPDNEKFDYIFLFDVLEHLKDPVKVLQNLKERKLSSRGIVIATFPVADSLSRKFLGNFWPQFKVEHLHYFTNKSIEEMASKSSLHLIKNEVLVKKLSAGYLMNVGKGFGPPAFKSVTKAVDKVIPSPLKKMNISMGYGERLVLLQK